MVESDNNIQSIVETQHNNTSSNYEIGIRLLADFEVFLKREGLLPLRYSPALERSEETTVSRDKGMVTGVGFIAKNLREMSGENQRTIARLAGISQIQYSRIERGISSPTENTIRRIANAFGVSVGTLFGENIEQSSQDD